MTDLALSMRQAGVSRTTQNRVSTLQIQTRPKIGQILVETGAITTENLQHAMKLAQDAKQPVGRMLVSLSYVKEERLQAALEAQSLIGKGTITEADALAAVRWAMQRNMRFDQAVGQLYDLSPEREDDGSLGGLIIASEMAPADTVTDAQNRTYEAGVHVGHILLTSKTITLTMLDNVLTVAVLLRDGVITRDKAVALLKDVRDSRTSMTSAIRLSKIKTNTPGEIVRLGELLIKARLVTEREALIAIEASLHTGRKLGDELVSRAAVTRVTLDQALVLQRLISQQVVSLETGIEILGACSVSNKEIKQVASELKAFDETATEKCALNLCMLAGILHHEPIFQAMEQWAHLGLSRGKAVLAANSINNKTYSAALKLAEQVESKKISENQAVLALKHCDRAGCDVEVAIAAVGLTPDQEPVSNAPKTCAQSVRGTLANWASYNEFLPLLCLGPVAAGGGYILVNYMHVSESIAMLFTLTVLSVGFIKYGRSWQARTVARQDANDLRMQCAQVTKNRLSQRR
jgi:hypothetical protein